MTKVFVINKGGHDFSSARRFGTLVFLSEGSTSKFATNKIYRSFVRKLNDSKPGDFILITGLTVMSSIACAIFARKHGRLNLLIFDGATSYSRRTLEIDSLLEEITCYDTSTV